MTEYILKRFAGFSGDTGDMVSRERCGRLAGAVGIASNLMLFAFKIAVGLMSGSISIMADAVNNLSDSASSLITLLAFRLSARPADAGHPYGHARYEYIGGLAVSCLILMIGLQFLVSSARKVVNPEEILVSPVVVAVLAVSIVVKFLQGRFNKETGQRIDSAALIATAADSRNDVLTTSAVLLSVLAAYFTGINIDGIMGVLVALFILYSGVGLIKDAMDPLLGTAPDKELVKEIKDRILSYGGVLGIHDLMVHNYGPGQTFASVHVEVSAGEDTMSSHDLVDNIERDITKGMGVVLVAHMDPVVIDDPKLDFYREIVAAVTYAIDPGLSFHDFRMVEGPTHTNLIFDVVSPPGLKLDEAELRSIVSESVAEKAGNPIYCVITVDKSYM